MRVWQFLAGFICGGHVLGAATVELAWDPSRDAAVISYELHYGGQSRAYTNSRNWGLVTTASVTNLAGHATYFFAVVAVASNGLVSDYSNEVNWQTEPKPNLKMLHVRNTRTNATLRGSTDQPALATFFELRRGADTNWTWAAPGTNAVLPALALTNWAARICSTNANLKWASAPLLFTVRLPLSSIRFEVVLEESATLGGTNWTEAGVFGIELPYPPPGTNESRFYRSFMNAVPQ